jgi:hypothetical protein
MNPGLPIADNAADFAVMLAVGIAVAAFYDIFRNFRMAVRKNGGKNWCLEVQLQDLLFSITAFLFVLLTIYKINDGIIRSYIVIGFALGCIVYVFFLYKILGRLFYGLFYGVLFCIKYILRGFKKIFRLIFRKPKEK